MNKKIKQIIIIVAALVIVLIFLMLLFIRLKPELLTGPGSNDVNDEYTKVNVENIVIPDISGPMVPTVIKTESKSESKVEANDEYPDEIEVKEASFQGESVLQSEQIIVVGTKDFQPKIINVVHNAKVPLIIRAIDDKEHTFVLELEETILTLDFSKKTGDLYYSFIGPKPGNYAFYIDNSDNSGILKSIEK